MVVTNSFRFGEVSRKQAGRFLEDGYQQGSFQFRNARTLYDGGMSRRYPVKTELTVDSSTKIYTIHNFGISDSTQYIIGIGRTSSSGTEANVIVVWQFIAQTDGSMALTEKCRLTSSLMSSTIGGDGIQQNVLFGRLQTGATVMEEVPLTETICRGIRFAQHYDRMYIVSHEFKTMYLEQTGSTLSAHIATFLFNQNAKEKIWYIPSDDEGEGVVLFKSNGNYYKSVDDMNSGTVYEVPAGKTPLLATTGYEANFNDYEDETDFNTTVGTYPSVVAVVHQSLFFANTVNHPNVIWKSRDIGSSQWLMNYSSDTMHDMCQFEVVTTTETELKSTDEWPTEESGYYYSEYGQDIWYVPEGVTVNTGTEDTPVNTKAEAYSIKLTRERRYWVTDGRDYLYYYTSGSNAGKQYTWTSSEGRPIYAKNDTDNTSGYDYKYLVSTDSEGKKTYAWLNNYTMTESYPLSLADSDSNKGYLKFSDYKWTLPNGLEYTATSQSQYPVKKPYTTYKLDDATALYEEKTSLSLVTTESCAVRMELNTGSEDAIKFIACGCGKVFIGTDSAEWTLPSDFGAVENKSASNYSSYGSAGLEPIAINKSFIFMQRAGIIREYYLYESYIQTADVTALNHEIFDGNVLDCAGIGSPDPVMYFVEDNGELVEIMYDRDGGLNSMAHWNSGKGTGTSKYRPFYFKSITATKVNGEKEILLLVKDTKEGSDRLHICSFDTESTSFVDTIGGVEYEFETLVETVYAEVNSQEVVFGRFKKAKSMWVRPYECGHILVGNDERSMTRSNYALGNTDCYFPVLGKSERNFSMFLKSVGREPMTILAMAWEIDNGS